MALNTMSIDKLMKLKDEIEDTLSAKILEQRRALEAELSKLGGYHVERRRLGDVADRWLRSIAIRKTLRRPGRVAD